MASRAEECGLIFAFCPTTDVVARLAGAIQEKLLDSDSVRVAACGSTVNADEAAEAVAKLSRRGIYMLPKTGLKGESARGFDDEPMLRACFDCLAQLPAGGAPWLGSWRTSTLETVSRGLQEGGVIFVASSESFEEERAWARALLQCGCTLVQIHRMAATARTH